MYGITISPTMISEGITTPAIHGSKYTSISCSPRKYHGAFEGFIVSVGFAGSSSGAFSVIDQTIRMTVTNDRRQKLDAQQVRPDVDFARPLRPPRLRLAVVRLGHFGIGLELRDQPVVGERLPQSVPRVEGNHEQQQHDGDVVRRC